MTKQKDRQIFIDGARLKRLRREHGLSQEALADACERQHLRISIATIKRAETNKPVTLRTLHNLAEFFSVSHAELSLHKEQYDLAEGQALLQNRLSVVAVVKVTDAEQHAAIQQQLNDLSPLFVKQHGAYVIAAFSQYVTAPDSANSGRAHILLLLEQMLTERPASLLSPHFCLISLEQLHHDGKGYTLPNSDVSRLLDEAMYVPANKIVVGDQLKFLYDLHFDFSPLQPGQSGWWVIEGATCKEERQIPLYGRDKELGRLKGQFDVSLGDGRLTLNCLAGDSGMGKTRMLEEMSGYAQSRGMQVIRLDAEQYETDWRLSLINRLEEWRPQGLAEDSDVLVATLENMPAGLALLIDNIHLCVSDALEQLAELSETLRGFPVAAVITSTFRYSDRVIRLLNPDSFIALSRLTVAECEKLAGHFKHHSREWLQQSIARSNGVPFYLNLLLEQVDPDSQQMPESIQLVLEEQLFALSFGELQAMQYLALAGASLPLDVLYVLAGQSDLKALRQSQLVRTTSDGQLEIANRLIRELVVETLKDEDRSERHGQLADEVEKAMMDGKLSEQTPSRDRLRMEWLYRQFNLAGNYFRAVIYQARYANLLIAADSYSEAETQLLEARDLLVTAALPEHCTRGKYTPEQCEDLKLDLLFYLANVYKMRYGWYSPVISDVYAEILELCDRTKSYHRKVNGLFRIWTIALMRLDIPEAIGYAQEALELSEQLEDSACKMQALTALGNTCFWAGRAKDAFRHSSLALEQYEPDMLESALEIEGQDPRMIAWCFKCLSALQLQDEQAESYLEDMIATSREVGHMFSLAIALQAGAWFSWKQRNVEKTLEYAAELEVLTAENAFPFYQGIAALFKGWAEYQQTPDEQHILTISTAFQRWLSSTGFRLTHSLYAALIGDVLISHGQQQEAVKVLEEAIGQAEQQGANCYLPELYYLMSRTVGDNSFVASEWVQKARLHFSCTPLQHSLFG
ncbi:AAA family ATPase [Aliamphritea spongicola]|uniref:AAA family ATPase n=1 Tax=Aliamphritea spongicola TaxID=707589 RepID=UPI00196AF020|nr:AAA family ATPase [Aliamphritea spongicola]MBN3561592.1 helix-turn-helix domain-containing protein [Aliamphritea spongicola]